MRHPLLVVLGGAFLFLGGLWLGHWIGASSDGLSPAGAESGRASASPQDRSVLPDNSEILREIRALRDDVLAELQQRPPQGRVAAGEGSESVRMSALIEALQTRIDGLPAAQTARRGAHTGSAGETAQGYASLAEMRDRFILAERSEEWGDVDSAINEFKRVHHFWTVERVVERYGVPDLIRPGQNRLTFLYNGPRSDGEEGRSLQFTIQEGFVVDVGYGN